MMQRCAALAATLVLAAPALAGFRKGERASMSGADVRVALQDPEGLFEDQASQRFLKLLNVSKFENESLRGMIGDTDVFAFAPVDGNESFYQHVPAGAGAALFFVEQIDEGSVCWETMKARKDGKAAEKPVS